MKILLIGGLGMPELLVILLLVLLLFGGKKLPEMMRALGRGVKDFKEGMNEVEAPKAKEGEVETKKEETKE